MTYRYAVRRRGLLLTRTLTRAKAQAIANTYPGSIVVPEVFTSGAL